MISKPERGSMRKYRGAESSPITSYVTFSKVSCKEKSMRIYEFIVYIYIYIYKNYKWVQHVPSVEILCTLSGPNRLNAVYIRTYL